MANLSLRVVSDIRKIEVNDNGDCIEVNFSDIKLMDKLDMFINKLNKIKDFGISISSEASELNIDSILDESIPVEERKLLAEQSIAELRTGNRAELVEMVVGIKEDFNALFGKDAVNKVFGNGGDITPSLAKYYDFLNIFIPVVKDVIVGNRKTSKVASKITPKKGGRR